jgi:golgi pH regulator
LGYLFSVYCVIKVITSTINIILNRAVNQDPVTRGLEILTTKLGFDIDLELYTTPLQFLFIGIMVLTAIRTLLIQAGRMKSKVIVSADLGLLILTNLMGFYFLSVVIMIRMDLPERFRRGITIVLGDLEITVFQRLFEYVFLASVGVAGIYHLMLSQSNRL